MSKSPNRNRALMTHLQAALQARRTPKWCAPKPDPSASQFIGFPRPTGHSKTWDMGLHRA